MAYVFEKYSVGGSGGGATVSVDGENWADGTAVPSDGFIEKVYVNTALSNEQVTEILSRLTYYPMNSYHGFDGDVLFINNNYVGLFVERQYTGAIRLYGHCQSTNDDIYGLLWSNEDGWEQTFVNGHNSTLIVNDTVSTSNVAEPLNNWTNYYEYTGTVGTQNALLTQLFSTTPFVKEQKTIQLDGNYDGSTVTVTENGALDIKSLLAEKKLPLTVDVEVAGSGGDIIEVDTLPTENIAENAVYKANYAGVEVYHRYGEYTSSYQTLSKLLESAGITAHITYYVVDELPASPKLSDLATFAEVHIYIYNNIPQLYGNAGYGNMWVGLIDLLASSGLTTEAKGFTSDIRVETEEGVFVTYYRDAYGVTGNGAFFPSGNVWRNHSKLIKEFVGGSLSGKIYAEELQGLSKIRSGAFEECDIEEIELPESVEHIGDYAFANTSLIKLPNLSKVKTIGDYAFKNISLNGEEIILPESLTGIGAYAFAGVNAYTFTATFTDQTSNNVCAQNTSLREATLREGSTHIPVGGFDNCQNLTTVNLPSTLTDIYYGCFAYCRKLTTINYNGTKAQWRAIIYDHIPPENLDYYRWNYETGNYTIYCTDGTIAKDGTET